MNNPNLTDHIEMATVLKKIITDKQVWLAQKKQTQPIDTFRNKLALSRRDFYQALTDEQAVFILECKKASPSKGLIRPDFDPTEIAQIYQKYANAISVLTDEKYFQGDLNFLSQVSQQVHQPVLCKDFIIDEYQIYLARFYQADAILLMLSVLNDDEYLKLKEVAHSLNMGVLTEASNPQEVQRAINLNAKVIGINNRDLRDLTVDLNRLEKLSKPIPNDRIIISESGFNLHKQIRKYSQYAHGFLIGSAIMGQADIEMATRQLLFGENKVCGLTKADDAKAAYQAGAVFGGVIFVKSSPRYLSPAQAKKVIESAKLNWVGVFRDEPIPAVKNIATELALFAVQLHGHEDDNYIKALRKQLPKNCQIWQAIGIDKSMPKNLSSLADRYLVDNQQGGSGKQFDWSLLKNQPLDNTMLAGGITPENCTQAMKTGVMGIDVNSGVEISPGIKDHNKVKTLFSNLRHYSIKKG